MPTEASGKRVIRYVPDGDTYDVHRTFISPELKREYGIKTVQRDTVSVPRDQIAPSIVEKGRTVVKKAEDTGVFGTREEHLNAEVKESQIGTNDLDPGDGGGYPIYDGPQYSYVSGSIDERTGPINVLWRRDLSLTAGTIQTSMTELDAWGTPPIPGDRYVLIRDNGTNYAKAQDKHVSDRTGATSQYHGRLWNIPTSDASDYGVVCQAHHDPFDHDKMFDNNNWKFDESQQAITDTWSNDISGYVTGSTLVGNGTGYGGDDSADGTSSVISN